MSSILRALKKLEDDPRHLQETQPLDSKFVPLADTSPPKKWPPILVVIIGGGVVCGLVLLAGFWLLSDKAQPPVPSTSIPEQNFTLEPSPAMPEEAESIQSSAPTVEPVPLPAATPVSEKIELQVPAPAPIVTTEKMAPISEEIEAVPPAEEVPQEENFEPPPTSLPDVSEKVPVSKAPLAIQPVPASPSVTKEVEIPVLRDSDVKLQAITWSKNPQKRIVVINNRILREGEAVHGYRIDTINPDDIILVENGEKWKLLFRIK